MAKPADGTGFRTVQHPVSDGQPHAASDRQDAANAFRETVPPGERRRFLAQQRHEQEHGRPARRATDEYRNGERRLRHDPPHPGAEQLPGRQRVVQVSGRTREDRSARGHSGRGQCAFVSVPGEGAGGVRLGQPGHDWRPVRRVRQRLEADVFLRGHRRAEIRAAVRRAQYPGSTADSGQRRRGRRGHDPDDRVKHCGPRLVSVRSVHAGGRLGYDRRSAARRVRAAGRDLRRGERCAGSADREDVRRRGGRVRQGRGRRRAAEPRPARHAE